MNIGVAVLATCADVVEHRFHVTLCALHALVKAAQGVMSLVVIKFGDGSNRFPTVGGVTVLAGNIQIAMRAVGSRGALVHPAGKRAEDE